MCSEPKLRPNENCTANDPEICKLPIFGSLKHSAIGQYSFATITSSLKLYKQKCHTSTVNCVFLFLKKTRRFMLQYPTQFIIYLYIYTITRAHAPARPCPARARSPPAALRARATLEDRCPLPARQLPACPRAAPLLRGHIPAA